MIFNSLPVKLSFHMIVFNSLSILPKGLFSACITNIYPFAHQIIIAEGAVRATQFNKGDATQLSPDGRSTDGTLEFLQNFPDPDHKIKILTTEGFWNGKLEMFKEISNHTSDDVDYVWEIDSDELYKTQDMKKIISLLSLKIYDRVDFYALNFFGDWNHCIDENYRGWTNQLEWRRIHKHSPKSCYLNHTPPVYSDVNGNIMNKNVLDREMTLLANIKLYHYSMVSRSQIEYKQSYYRAGGTNYIEMWNAWQKDHNVELLNGDKSLPFLGEHPEIIQKLIKGE